MKKIRKLVIATHNPAKKERFRNLFLGIINNVFMLDDFNIIEKPQEHGTTAEENAEIKAKFYSQKLDLPVFAEDEALYVDFLPPEKQPGVFVRRIEGKDEASDDELLNYWKEVVERVPEEKRTGRWHFAYCLAFPNDLIKTFVSDCEILFFSPPSKTIIPGWPMSSLEGPVKFRKPHSELSDVEREEYNQTTNRLILEKLRELLSIKKAEERRIEIPYGKDAKAPFYFYLPKGYAYRISAVNEERFSVEWTGKVRQDGAEEYLAKNNDGHGSAVIIYRKQA